MKKGSHTKLLSYLGIVENDLSENAVGIEQVLNVRICLILRLCLNSFQKLTHIYRSSLMKEHDNYKVADSQTTHN